VFRQAPRAACPAKAPEGGDNAGLACARTPSLALRLLPRPMPRSALLSVCPVVPPQPARSHVGRAPVRCRG
jgi:hypothetical protein